MENKSKVIAESWKISFFLEWINAERTFIWYFFVVRLKTNERWNLYLSNPTGKSAQKRKNICRKTEFPLNKQRFNKSEIDQKGPYTTAFLNGFLTLDKFSSRQLISIF